MLINHYTFGAVFFTLFVLGLLGLFINEERWPRVSKWLTRTLYSLFGLIFFGSMIGSLFESATGCAP